MPKIKNVESKSTKPETLEELRWKHRPHRCKYCGEGFAYAINLRKHEKECIKGLGK